jgi:hypothetical protein
VAFPGSKHKPSPGTVNTERLQPEQFSRPGPWYPFSSSRVSEARYDKGLQQIHVIFRDGTPWVYDGVEPNIWRNFRRSASPGRFINRVLNGYTYYRGGFDYADSTPGEGDET